MNTLHFLIKILLSTFQVGQVVIYLERNVAALGRIVLGRIVSGANRGRESLSIQIPYGHWKILKKYSEIKQNISHVIIVIKIKLKPALILLYDTFKASYFLLLSEYPDTFGNGKWSIGTLRQLSYGMTKIRNGVFFVVVVLFVCCFFFAQREQRSSN
jgi:hypothetical protein